MDENEESEVPEDIDALVKIARQIDNETMRPLWVLRCAIALLPENFGEGAILLPQQRGARTRARNAAKELREIIKKYSQLMEEL